ncbi:uncharacterized protein LOC124110922 isoform X3 [Haliotis rufescens]|uniref:uncharacterized protein LOC124110922 isoform X3 n=1 Tax=Haliotis rufescens TaxID=6454 RepID=UPI00201EE7A1|nr:uncharacterized protein LOC124110922 isoform X3 [Haliotis rufescens]
MLNMKAYLLLAFMSISLLCLTSLVRVSTLNPGRIPPSTAVSIHDSQISSPSTRCRVSPNPLSSADRPDVPVTHGGTIETDMELLWSSAVSTRTYQVYQSGVNTFLTFMTMQGFVWITTLPPISEDILIRFVAHCYRRLLLRYSTIKSYLCSIRFRYLQVGLPNPWTSDFLIRLQTIVQGVKRHQGLSTSPRLPITTPILTKMCMALNHGVFDHYTCVLLKSVCCLAFFGFLRCGEFACDTDKFNPVYNLTLRAMQFSRVSASFTLLLAASKTDPVRKGVTITYTATAIVYAL